jgi:hypothetical protein
MNSKMVTRLYTLNEIARETREPYSSLHSLVRNGELKPDSITSRFFLFDSSRLGEIDKFLSSRRRPASSKDFENAP